MGLAVGFLAIILIGIIAVGLTMGAGGILCCCIPFLKTKWIKITGVIKQMYTNTKRYSYLVECTYMGKVRNFMMLDLGNNRSVGETVSVLLNKKTLDTVKAYKFKWWWLLIGGILIIGGIAACGAGIYGWIEMVESLESYNANF